MITERKNTKSVGKNDSFFPFEWFTSLHIISFFFVARKSWQHFPMIFWVVFWGPKQKTPGSAAGELCKKSIDAVKGDLPMAPWRLEKFGDGQPPKGKM